MNLHHETPRSRQTDPSSTSSQRGREGGRGKGRWGCEMKRLLNPWRYRRHEHYWVTRPPINRGRRAKFTWKLCAWCG